MNKQLTAMQELRQRILIRYPYGAEDMTNEMKDMQSWLIEEIDLASIPKEKEQIEKAYHQGMNDGEYPSMPQMGEIYYQNTYQNKSITQ